MDRFMAKLHCPQCGADFPVELQKMRFNSPHPCPSCGAQYSISRDSAIEAHRLLERLEYQERMVSPIPQSGALSA
jgi:predicted RNA-binding Zn-ribbon protein involved in translation (DUF1610 family)